MNWIWKPSCIAANCWTIFISAYLDLAPCFSTLLLRSAASRPRKALAGPYNIWQPGPRSKYKVAWWIIFEICHIWDDIVSQI